MVKVVSPLLREGDDADAFDSGGGGSISTDSREPHLETDFVHTNAVQDAFTMAIIGTGSSITNAPAAARLGPDHPGVVLFRSGTTANSGAQCFTALDRIRLGGGEQWDANVCPLVFTATTFRTGFGDQITSTAFVDGAWFEFSGSGAIVGKTRSNSVESVTSTIATLVVNTWYHLRLKVNAAGTSVTFEVFGDAGASLGSATLSANIPTASGREVGCGSIATNSGTTATDLICMDRQRMTNPGRTVARGAEDGLTSIKGLEFFCSGKPANSEVIAGFVSPVAFTLVETNCVCKALVAFTAAKTFDIKNNGTAIGTIAFAAAGTVGTVDITTPAIAIGDYVSITAPATADTTGADIAGLLRN